MTDEKVTDKTLKPSCRGYGDKYPEFPCKPQGGGDPWEKVC